jgi:hypothetical protein
MYSQRYYGYQGYEPLRLLLQNLALSLPLLADGHVGMGRSGLMALARLGTPQKGFVVRALAFLKSANGF